MEQLEIKVMLTTRLAFLKWQVDEYNKTSRPANGYVCTVCKNRRYFALINNAGDFALRPCTCQNQMAALRRERQ